MSTTIGGDVLQRSRLDQCNSQIDYQLESISAFHSQTPMQNQQPTRQVQLPGGSMSVPFLTSSNMQVSGSAAESRGPAMSAANMVNNSAYNNQGMLSSLGMPGPSITTADNHFFTSNPASAAQLHQQPASSLLLPGNFHTVTSGLPLQGASGGADPCLGSLDGAQLVGEGGGRVGVLDSLNSAMSSTTPRSSMFGTQALGGLAPAAAPRPAAGVGTRSIVLTVAPTSAPVSSGPSAGLMAGKSSQEAPMETVPSAESTDALAGADMRAKWQSQQQQRQLEQQAGIMTRQRQQAHRRAKEHAPKYSQGFTNDFTEDEFSDDLSDDSENNGDSEDFSRSVTPSRGGLQSTGGSLQSVDAQQFKSMMGTSAGGSGVVDGGGLGGRRSSSGAQKKPRKQLLCEQDPDAPGLTLEQRRKIRRRINNRASARRVRQKREEDLHRITSQVTSLDEEKRRLVQRVTQTQSNCAQMAAQLKEVRDRWQATCLTNVTLYRELMSLRGDLELWQRPGSGGPTSTNMRQPGTMTNMALPMGPPSTSAGGQLPPSSAQGGTRAASIIRARAPSGPFNINPAGSFDLGSFFAS